MHREYHPADMDHLRAHAFGGGPAPSDHDHHHSHDERHNHHDDRRWLYALTSLMGLLIGGDVVFGWLGLDAWRSPAGVNLSFLAALIGGSRIVYGALEALLHGSVGADVALAQACLAALVIGEPFVAAEVVFIALVGEVLEAVTFDRTQRAIHHLLDASPRTARVRRGDQDIEIPAGEVVVGDLVIIRPGEKVPVDGPIITGRSTVDQSALTGEPIPADKGPGDQVYTGCLNQFGVIEVQAEKVGHETTFGQVLKLTAQARKRKAPLERTADKLARYFLPLVEGVAGLTLLAGYLLGWPDVWLRAVAVLVVACPCALILATPAAVLASMAWLARHGVLIKGGAALERLAACDAFAFDKTGTLTLGQPEVSSVTPIGAVGEAELLRLAATAEAASTHPLAQALGREAVRRGLSPDAAVERSALPGSGVEALYQEDGHVRALLVGNLRLMRERGVPLGDEILEALGNLDSRGETPLIVARDGEVVGLIGASDAVRPEAHDVIHELKHLNIKMIAILTGDRASAAGVIARKVHVKTVESELLPAEKARWVEQAQSEGRKVAMVGDGINDAPALAAAHVGIALGGIGADLAAEAGDLIILGEPLTVLPDLVKLSRATVSIIRQNILGFAFGLNAVAMGSAALGLIGPVAAALLHQAGSLLVLLNAMRLLAFGDWRELPPLRQFFALGRAIGRWDDRVDLELMARSLAGRWRGLVWFSLCVGILIYTTWGWTALGPSEVGLVQRFGRFEGLAGPGFHMGWPPPVERLTRLRPHEVRAITLGFRSEVAGTAGSLGWGASHERAVSALAEDESLLLTGDGQYVELTSVVHFSLDAKNAGSLRAFAFGVADAGAALRPIAEASIRSILGRRSLDSLLGAGRHEAELASARLARERAGRYGLGVRIASVEFIELHPPVSVVDAYRDVSRAQSGLEQRRNEGMAFAATTAAAAKGKASALVEAAEGSRARVVSQAAGAADSFRVVASARQPHPELTDARLHLESVAASLTGRAKLILDPDAKRPRHLIMPGSVDATSLIPAAGAVLGPPSPPIPGESR